MADRAGQVEPGDPPGGPMRRNSVRRWLRRIWVAVGIAFMVWLAWNAQAHGVDPAVLRSTDEVLVVDSGPLLRFAPRWLSPGAGLIFLPGAAVEPAAYAPLLRAVAEAGFPATLVRLPWRLAPTAASRAVLWGRIAAIRAGDPSRRWLLAGHSRGAALSAQFAAEHAQALSGLVLIGTTHPKRTSLGALALPVTKVYGTRDCVAPVDAVLANAHLLPDATHWVRLEGANHQQFGWYGRQLGDCRATISRAAQQAATLRALLSALTAASAEPSR
ncbi:MAG: alpha/beta hydrolase [Gemmatimonadales bacterium]